MSWQSIAGKIASFGLPILSTVIGGAIEEVPILRSLVDGPALVESVGRKAIAAALGVENTPEAIGKAIETKPTTEVLTTLKGVESGLVDKWPELAQLAQTLAVESTKTAAVEAEDRKDARRAFETTNPLATQQRRLAVVWIVGFFVLMAIILFLNIKYPEIKLNDVFVLILGVALGAVKDVNQFFFGSSAGSAAKDATIREITATANPPPVVVAPVKVGKK
jgi:hypothetical protein